MNILVTGGPVHANLDAVKIITNKFRGSLMASLAGDLHDMSSCPKVKYLTSKSSYRPQDCDVVFHDGINDYMNKVLELAPQMDAVVLGAAVANLIPLNPIEGKFPSHNFKPGDIIPIDFTIAPRVIDEVKKNAPKTNLFGFKLLSGVPLDELITAAYGVLLESKATAIFANDATDLNVVYMVTKERAVHQMPRNLIASQVMELAKDEYYKTIVDYSVHYAKSDKLERLVKYYNRDFLQTPEGYVFGTVAVRDDRDQYNLGGFWTTCRGKRELSDQAYVLKVDHVRRIVHASTKASLNAPLLDNLFKCNPDVNVIVHTHTENPKWPRYDYAPSGTVRDSNRMIYRSFNIKNHGSFELIGS